MLAFLGFGSSSTPAQNTPAKAAQSPKSATNSNHQVDNSQQEKNTAQHASKINNVSKETSRNKDESNKHHKKRVSKKVNKNKSKISQTPKQPAQVAEAANITKSRKYQTKQNEIIQATPIPSPRKSQSKPQTLTKGQQLERQQILNILLDDAGKDWKPRDKAPKRPVQKNRSKLSKSKQGSKVRIGLSKFASESVKSIMQPKKQTAQRTVSQKTRTKTPATISSEPARVLTKSSAMTPAQKLEQQQILNVLLDDAGKDWKPRIKTTKQSIQKLSTNTSKQAPATTSNQVSVTSQKQEIAKTFKKMQGKIQSPKSAVSPSFARQGSIGATTVKGAQQLELQQILNILIDDVGRDSTPRSKKAARQRVKKEGAKPNRGKQNPLKTPTPKVSTLAKKTPKFTSTKTLSQALTPALQMEHQQILNILIDETGSEWKARSTWPWSPKASEGPVNEKSLNIPRKSPRQTDARNSADSASSKVTAPKSAPLPIRNKLEGQSSVAVTGAKLTRRSSLTDAQRKEKREIMEILLESYEFVPMPIQRRGSTTQRNAELNHKVGNVVVVVNPAVDVNEDLSGFETVKSRRTSIQEKRDIRSEKDSILAILQDWVEPIPKKQPVAAKKSPAKHSQKTPGTTTKAQSNINQKSSPRAAHIQTSKGQIRAYLAT